MGDTKRKRTMNEIASDRCAELWREWFKTPAGKERLKQAEQAKRFQELLRKELRKLSDDE